MLLSGMACNFFLIVIIMGPCTQAQLEKIANVRHSRNDDGIKSSKRHTIDYIPSSSDFHPVVYNPVGEVPRKPGFQSVLFPPITSASQANSAIGTTVARQITTSYTPPQEKPRRIRRDVNRPSRASSSYHRQVTGKRAKKYQHHHPFLTAHRPSLSSNSKANKHSNSHAPQQRPTSLPHSTRRAQGFSASPTIFYQNIHNNNNKQQKHPQQNVITSTYTTTVGPNYQSVSQSSVSPKVYIKSPSSKTYPVLQQKGTNQYKAPATTTPRYHQSTSLKSAGNLYIGPSKNNNKNNNNNNKVIWRDQVDNFHQGNVQQTSGYDVPPVLVDNSKHHHSGNRKSSGLKTGYFPPSQRVMPRVTNMQAECSDDVMKLTVNFNASFEGLIYSAGYAYDDDCIYIKGTGDNQYEFYIQLNRCGTLGGSDHNKKRDVLNGKNTDPTKNFMWNTVTIQYSPLIEEEWDEHFKVTCEYGYDFWKTVTFPFLDVDKNGKK